MKSLRLPAFPPAPNYGLLPCVENEYVISARSLWLSLVLWSIIRLMNLLLVEDDIEIADSLTHSLHNRGFAVDVALDGEDGLRKARWNNYDIIILDKGLPKKNGMEVCSSIRSAGKHTPILILSASFETDSKVELLNAGADDYMTKPFSFAELEARINVLLRRPEKAECIVFQIGDLSVNIEGRTVMRRKKELHLTTKEFALIEYFLRNRGKAIPRQEILEHVWDINADPFTNTIETHISTLRRKIETEGGEHIIHTVPGIGYKIC